MQCLDFSEMKNGEDVILDLLIQGVKKMISKKEYNESVKYVMELFTKAGIKITGEEKAKIEVADFGLSRLDEIGLQLLTYINTNRVCAKEMALKPYQTCPEHWHIPTNGMEGKEETFRCRYGKVYLYVDGDIATGTIGLRISATSGMGESARAANKYFAK